MTIMELLRVTAEEYAVELLLRTQEGRTAKSNLQVRTGLFPHKLCGVQFSRGNPTELHHAIVKCHDCSVISESLISSTYG
jgi:hypothetical protein